MLSNNTIGLEDNSHFFLTYTDARSNNLQSMDSAALLEAKSRQSCATARTTVSGRCIALAFQRVPTQKCIHKAVKVKKK